MKVKAKERELSIFNLFFHEDHVALGLPFNDRDIARELNKKADELFPNMLVVFICPSDSDLDQWNVRFNKDRYDYDKHYQPKYEQYPIPHVDSESALKRAIPAALYRVLKAMDNVVVEL